MYCVNYARISQFKRFWQFVRPDVSFDSPVQGTGRIMYVFFSLFFSPTNSENNEYVTAMEHIHLSDILKHPLLNSSYKQSTSPAVHTQPGEILRAPFLDRLLYFRKDCP